LTRQFALLALLLLAACSPKREEAVVMEPVAVEPVFVEPEPSAGLTDTKCKPGDDDGIGGTGCKID
jgi:hypothetical protein